MQYGNIHKSAKNKN